MITIALRFADNFAPDCGTISAHDQMISQYGYVWYGKMGGAVSKSTAQLVMNNPEPKILLIHSGRQDRYWAYVDDIVWATPPLDMIPEYYRDNNERFKTWFRVRALEPAEKKVMSNCTVVSSGALLTEASKRSLSPFFVIRYSSEMDSNS